MTDAGKPLVVFVFPGAAGHVNPSLPMCRRFVELGWEAQAPAGSCQWLFLVPVKGGIGGIVHPPIGRKNTTNIPLIVLAFWRVICYLPPFTGTRNNH